MQTGHVATNAKLYEDLIFRWLLKISITQYQIKQFGVKHNFMDRATSVQLLWKARSLYRYGFG